MAEEREAPRGRFAERPLIEVKLQTLAQRYIKGELGRDEYEVMASHIVEEEIEVLTLRDERVWELFTRYLSKAIERVLGKLPKPKLGYDVRGTLKDYMMKYRREVFGEKLGVWTDRDLEERINVMVSGLIYRAGLATLKDLGYVK